MLNMKKTLVIGTVLTAFCASAFAATADTQTEKPSMSERVNAILHEDDNDRPCPPPGEHRHHDKRGAKLTPEQRAEREKMRAEWEKMTPEQRKEVFEKHEKERKERHEKHAKETMAKLTASQKAEVEQFIKDDMAQRKDMHERLQKMTPEQREAVKANKPLPPKPPKKFDKHHKGFHHDGPRDWKDGDRPCPPPPPPAGAHHGGPHHAGDFPPPPPADEK